MTLFQAPGIGDEHEVHERTILYNFKSTVFLFVSVSCCPVYLFHVFPAVFLRSQELLRQALLQARYKKTGSLLTSHRF